ncbi:MAG TPA: C4-type zinc ribbon domain-containing protein [Terracidiphilus sp.]|nr:C4-type zinc ribbon domain-containing protein [Terracidiphilus sp.]
MHALIEHLAKLQAVELDRARVTKEASALPAQVKQAEAALAAAQKQSADASSGLSREETLRTRLERETDGHRQKAAKFRAQLDVVKTPAQAEAIEHEVGFATKEIERLENDELASMERSEMLEVTLAQARAQVEQFAEALEKTRARVNASLKELAEQLATLGTERETVRQQIEPEWLARFDRIASLRGTGIARAENQQCTGCRMGVRPQTWNQLREGELLTCDSCSRLLYWDDTMTPAPKVPQAEPAPGAGRAVRRPSQAGA